MMKRFEQEFGAEVVRLNVNYRCSGKITEAAGRFIGHNRNRFPKEIIPFKGAGEEICIMEFPDEEAELTFLKEHMENYKREHPDKTGCWKAAESCQERRKILCGRMWRHTWLLLTAAGKGRIF